MFNGLGSRIVIKLRQLLGQNAVFLPDVAVLAEQDDGKDDGQQGDDEYADGLKADIVGTRLLPFGLHLLLQGVVAGDVLSGGHLRDAALYL